MEKKKFHIGDRVHQPGVPKVNWAKYGKVTHVDDKHQMVKVEHSNGEIGTYGYRQIEKIEALEDEMRKDLERRGRDEGETSQWDRDDPCRIVPSDMDKWKVSEYEGSTNRLIETWTFNTQQEALEYWQRRVDGNKFAGIGGKWRHYFSYPEKAA